MSNYRTLKERFPDKKLVRFIAVKGDCDLSLKERWVYSTLLWRYKSKPVSKARLSKWTGVDRTRTLPRVLTRLSNLRLVIRSGKKYKAVQPPEDMMRFFATWIRGMGDKERLVLSNNWAVYDPEYGIIDNLVVCDDALGRHAAAKLARRYGVCAKTISAARRRLKAKTQEGEFVSAATEVVNAVEEKSTMPFTFEGIGGLRTVPLTEETPPQLSLPEKVVAQWTTYRGIEPVAAKELARLCRLLQGLSQNELGQIISALVAKYGIGDGLEDAVNHIIQTHRPRYFSGVSLRRVLTDIGVACNADADDELSMVGD